DADTLELKGQVADTPGVHGIAVAPDAGRGFTSNGRADTLTVFDLKTLRTLGTVPTGKNPDAILYDPASRRVFAFNGRSASATAFDAMAGLVLSSCGDGTVSVVRQESPDKYTAGDALKTRPGSKTMALDPRTRRLFIPAAEFAPASGSGRPKATPGSFAVMVY